MKNFGLYKRFALNLVQPESRHVIHNVFDKFEEDKNASVCDGLNHIFMFLKHENQMVAGAALTGFVLGMLLTQACEEKLMVEILETYLDGKTAQNNNVVDFNQIRKDRSNGKHRKH